MPPAALHAGGTFPDIWRDPAGNVVGETYVAEGSHWIRLRSIGDYWIRPGHPIVVAAPDRPDRLALLREAFDRVVQPFALELAGHDLLHASGVVTERGVVAFCGTKEAGKSTIAFALGQRGFRLWADDALLFELAAESVLAVPLPFAIRLRPPSAAFFGRSESPNGSTVAVPVETESEALPLDAVCILERTESGSDVRVERVDAASAFPLVLVHGYILSGDEPLRRRQMVQSYLGLVARVPVYRARFPAGLGQLSSTLAEIERVVIQAASE